MDNTQRHEYGILGEDLNSGENILGFFAEDSAMPSFKAHASARCEIDGHRKGYKDNKEPKDRWIDP